MPRKRTAIQASPSFWKDITRVLLTACHDENILTTPRDYSHWRVIVPTFTHAQQLKAALAEELGGVFIPPRISTLSAWLAVLPLLSHVQKPESDSQRLMRLYAELRQHAWLKKLFSARRNTDLLPLAQTLLALSDELTQAFLPSLLASSNHGNAKQHWDKALEQLTPTTKQLLSDEAQLVWSVWKSQLDKNDAIAVRFKQMQQYAHSANGPLVWISSVAPEPIESDFLDQYAKHQLVLQVTLTWQTDALLPAYTAAWPELIDTENAFDRSNLSNMALPSGIALAPAKSMEDEAIQGAQIILDWLQHNKNNLAIVAQDRVVARRISALLKRAQVYVTDETGWKLSTTRAASALVTWFDLINQQLDIVCLLDVLKSPFILNDVPCKAMHVMTIETVLRRANISGGWDNIRDALAALPAEQKMIDLLQQQAQLFTGHKTLRAWVTTTSNVDSIGLSAALRKDAAGQQIMQMLGNIVTDDDAAQFSFSEWCALVRLQLEQTSFINTQSDKRVVMLPLNGARMRHFDAVLLVGADANHLPSPSKETLFFTNTVRHELGLLTRERRQHQQMRDLMELLAMNTEVVLSWQAYQDNEKNPVSPWIERLQLTLAQHGLPTLPQHHITIAQCSLPISAQHMPTPTAAGLLPERLSSSAYSSFIACPYQFFAKHLLRLTSLDALSDLPEKRDYGAWLHHILHAYHEHLRDYPVPNSYEQRETLLRDISTQYFNSMIAKNPAALAYFVRWQKAITAYVNWANEREAQGWQFVLGEVSYQKKLAFAHGEITLHGRIDRIDEHVNGERAVLDYKTSSVTVLNKKIKDDEDHQLAFYGLLAEAPITAAHYVALEPTKEKIVEIAAPNYEQAQQRLAQQISSHLQAIADSTPLPANGALSACQYCDVRGLCRKGAW